MKSTRWVDVIRPLRARILRVHINDQLFFFLTADVNDSGQCSIARKGIYAYQDKTFDCSGTVNIGCQTPNEIVVETTCSKDADQFRKGKLNLLTFTQKLSGISKFYQILRSVGIFFICIHFLIENYISKQ